MRKNTIVQRLNIIKGQINGLTNLIEENKGCHQVTEQFYAINAGLKKAMELYFKADMASCLKSVNFKKRKTIEFLLKEIVENK
ncbi:MAG: metal-sensing transcriptional repressor [Patescibacteria group bacterium]|nr:metal-sensing transcriptional repressor [Patescibacteria group bacterium]